MGVVIKEERVRENVSYLVLSFPLRISMNFMSFSVFASWKEFQKYKHANHDITCSSLALQS